MKFKNNFHIYIHINIICYNLIIIMFKLRIK